MESVGNRLRMLRQSSGLTQDQVSKLAETTQIAINFYETDRATPPISVFLWYAKYFDVSMDYIFGLCDDRRGRYIRVSDEEADQIVEKKPDWSEFVEACFEPSSELNRKLKQMVMDMADQHR